jgi:type III pantothenate kinase
VPDVSVVLKSLLEKRDLIPFDIDTANDKILKIEYDVEQLGSDRLANGVAAYRKYSPPLLVIDFGTATTYNVVQKEGIFAGGIIAPGIKTCIDFLIDNSGLLTPIELKRPQGFLGHTTEGSLLSGYYYTYLGQMKEIISRVEKDFGMGIAIIGTGGLVDFAKEDFPRIILDRDLTLHGIRLLHEANTVQ